MDSKTFDALTRGLGSQGTRRHALKGIAAGLFGLGAAKGAAAQDFTAQRNTCRQKCQGTRDCNSGFRCGPGSESCVALPSSRDRCDRNLECRSKDEVCKSGRCVNQVDCPECFENDDCPGRRGRCRNGRCR